MPFTYMSRNRANPGQRSMVTVMDGGSDPKHNLVVTSPAPWRHFGPSTWDACSTNPFTSNGLLLRLYHVSTLIQQFAKFLSIRRKLLAPIAITLSQCGQLVLKMVRHLTFWLSFRSFFVRAHSNLGQTKISLLATQKAI